MVDGALFSTRKLCMQVKKANVKRQIIRAARKEMLAKGFKGASLRSIAAKAGVSLSNIYNYFRSKDDILSEVLGPLLRALDAISDAHNKPEHISTEIFTSDKYQRESIDNYVELITQYRQELRLLLFKSHGSRFEHFVDAYTNQHTQTGIEYLAKMKRKYPRINANISEFFIHTMSAWWLSIIGEIVSHDLTADEIETFITEYMAFGTGGWKQLMAV